MAADELAATYLSILRPYFAIPLLFLFFFGTFFRT
jgi:hypothetical protein